MKGCQPALFLILPYIQGVQVQAMETSSIHPEKEVEVDADRSARKKMEVKAEVHKEDTVHVKEMCCREERGEEVKKDSKEKNSQ